MAPRRRQRRAPLPLLRRGRRTGGRPRSGRAAQVEPRARSDVPRAPPRAAACCSTRHAPVSKLPVPASFLASKGAKREQGQHANTLGGEFAGRRRFSRTPCPALAGFHHLDSRATPVRPVPAAAMRRLLLSAWGRSGLQARGQAAPAGSAPWAEGCLIGEAPAAAWRRLTSAAGAVAQQVRRRARLARIAPAGSGAATREHGPTFALCGRHSHAPAHTHARARAAHRRRRPAAAAAAVPKRARPAAPSAR